jgi:hypothetical protein
MSEPKTLTPEQIEEYRELFGLDWELTRELSLKDLWFFINEVLFADDYLDTGETLAQWHYQESLHKDLADMVSEAKPGSKTLVLMPRFHRKSYILTIAQCVWRIIKDPNIRILVISATHSKSVEFISTVKKLLQYNKGIKKYFPEFHVDPARQFGTEQHFTHPLRTLIDPNPTVRSSYLGGRLAGGRCDLLIFDDCIEKDNVTTPEQADKALKNFNDTIPLMDEHPWYNMIYVVGTRWGFNDVYGAILGEDRGDGAAVNLTSAGWRTHVRHCLEDEHGNADINGKPIFGHRYSRERLLELLEDYKKDPNQGEEDWWKQMMNICQSPKARKFHEEWFDSWVDRVPGGVVWSGMAADTATKDEQVIMKGDFTGVLCGHFDTYGHLYLTDAIHSDALKSPELMDSLKSMASRNSTFNVVKEKVGEEMFFGMVKSEFNRARMPLTTYPVSVRGQGKKVIRIIEACQGPLMARQVHFVKGFPRDVWKKLVAEFTHLGQWTHDDLADALSLFFHKDIRIKPAEHSAQPWSVRNTRATQQSSALTNPASLSNWTTRAEPSETGRGDPFLDQQGGVDDIPMDRLMRDWISGRK